MTTTLDEIAARADVIGRCLRANPNDCYDRGDLDEAVIAAREDVPQLVAALRAVEALHIPAGYTESVIDWDCIEGECGHDDDCPEKTITPCRQCTLPSHDGAEILIPWPCPTIAAIREALGS